jgi:hypothetical protein
MTVAAFISLLTPLLSPHNLIMSDQNGTRPPKPYATVSLRTIRPARYEESEPDDTGDVDVWQHQLNTVEVQIFGDNASDLANMLALKLNYPSTHDKAELLNVGIVNVGSVLRVPELLNTSQYEERAIIEFTAYDVLLGTDNVGIIESAEIECFDHTHIVSKPI